MKNQPDIKKRTLGVTFSTDHQADVTLWNPLAKKVELSIRGRSISIPLVNDRSGYWHLETDQLKPGDLYTFTLDDEKICADPASLVQPQGAYGPSQAVDTNKFYWEDSCWVNPPLDEYVIYELDMSTFSPEGTFDAVVKKLGELKSLGINALLIKSVSSFPGSPNELFIYAVQASYGSPYQLQRLINACHFEGMAVILDVNYAKIGRQNDQLKAFRSGKQKAERNGSNGTNDEHGEAGRRYLIENALMWFRDFHIDALRLEAIYALPDAEEILTDIRTYTNQLTALTGNHHCLLVEHEPQNESVTEKTATPNAEREGPFEPVSTTERYDSYCSDYQPSKLSIKTYREDYLYDDHFSSVLRELFGRQAEPDESRGLLRSF
ncbi:hypothetical protein EXU85_23410 [Spirosoma sp. KCTC 42546]|uniref:alpha-amylase family glycosyl hydrolase n=1 Tax=Spirosoma sp. KCTC 42546 TaxID=2520506 RepID=UPI001157357B|nr:alpha-amylase family glycosyl hydrolase [Spirosoma sp. KCTC 42546]QDK81395.1 hypothetical protein EXU85_23410 [Spirosoma sp. KCTC 42546]